jgi:hypothetical protein
MTTDVNQVPVFSVRCWYRFAVIALFTAALPSLAQDAPQQEAAGPTFKSEEIEQLVAPIALYPDSLLAQILMASTYPLEIVEAARWAKEHPDLKGKALEDALQKQTWDASVKSLTAFPQVLSMMNEKLDWTQKLGDACLAQQGDVMAAVQRLRNKAKAEGNLQTTKEQKVIVEDKPITVEQTVNVQPPPPQTIIIEPADPQVVYVPTYNPTTVYGAWPNPSYPPYSYYPPGYVAATSIMSFGIGMAAGAALWGDCDWNDCCGGGDDLDVNVNNYNSFNRTDIKNGNWQHNAEHRKGVGYRDKATQQRYGKGGQQGRQQAASRDAFRGRAESGRQELARQGGADRARQQAAAADRARQGGQRQQGRPADRPGGGQRPQAGQADRPGAGSQRPQAGQADRPGAGSRDRAAAQRPSQAQRRDSGGATRQQQPNRGAFSGSSSPGSDVRRQADRGRSSRQSAMSRGGGGGRGSFGGGGGGRGGGGSRGGGGRGGGGGGRRR